MLRAAVEEALDAAAAGRRLDRIALVVPRLAELRDELERLLDDWAVPASMTTADARLEAPIALALTHLLHLGEGERDDSGGARPPARLAADARTAGPTRRG